MEGLLQQFQVMTKPIGVDVLERFPETEGRYTNFIKEVCFMRYVGFEEEQAYLRAIERMDTLLQAKSKEKQAGYLRIAALDTKIPTEKMQTYLSMYAAHQTAKFPFHFENPMWDHALHTNYQKVLELFQTVAIQPDKERIQEFGIRILYWIDTYFPKLFLETMKMRRFPKFVCGGEVKLQEYLFLYLLVLQGCDVLYLNAEKDICVASEILCKLSCLCEERHHAATLSAIQMPPKSNSLPLPPRQPSCPSATPIPAGHTRETKPEDIPVKVVLPPRQKKREQTQSGDTTSGVKVVLPPRQHRQSAPSTQAAPAEEGTSSVKVVLPPRHSKQSGASPNTQAVSAGGTDSGRKVPVRSHTHRGQFAPHVGTEPLDYVDLAKRASSIVMIEVYNDKRECYKTGSGIIISEQGYILTNFHVACEAEYYGIRLEEEEEIYYTDRLIKYNQYHDLAVLKMEHNRTPIPVYQGAEELVRGQKVVAIGSPLGLFNTVSDGIISGFRKMEDVSMIQFTAPISPGSSGGALLDLYGNLVGVITAHIGDGQNLNLAVDYKTVKTFAGGFL